MKFKKQLSAVVERKMKQNVLFFLFDLGSIKRVKLGGKNVLKNPQQNNSSGNDTQWLSSLS